MSCYWEIEGLVDVAVDGDGGQRVTEKPEEGEHHISTGPISVLGAEDIDVSVEVSDVSSNAFMLYLTTDDGSSYQIFDLTENKPANKNNFGLARLLDSSVKKLKDDTFSVSASFALLGTAKTASVRVQLLRSPDESSIYLGDADKGMTIGKAGMLRKPIGLSKRIHLTDSRQQVPESEYLRILSKDEALEGQKTATQDEIQRFANEHKALLAEYKAAMEGPRKGEGEEKANTFNRQPTQGEPGRSERERADEIEDLKEQHKTTMGFMKAIARENLDLDSQIKAAIAERDKVTGEIEPLKAELNRLTKLYIKRLLPLERDLMCAERDLLAEENGGEKANYKAIEKTARAVLKEDEFSGAAYRVLIQALDKQHRGEDAAKEKAKWGLAIGRLQKMGDLAQLVDMYGEMNKILPDETEHYYLLYKLMNDALDEVTDDPLSSFEAKPPVPEKSSKKRLVISISLWGERYAEIFVKYFIPSVLSPNNLPAVAKKREIHLDLYLPASDWETVRRAASFRKLKGIVSVNMFEMPERLAQMEHHPNNNFKYVIYGNLHQASIRRARLLNADIICIAPDGVHADGSYDNMVRFIDEGYKAVAFSSLRGQMESISPILDKMCDENDQVLTIPPRTLVGISTKNIHHVFQNYIASNANKNFMFASYVLYPDQQGMVVRTFHMHPIILSAECIQKLCPIDGETVDAGFTENMFPNPKDWKDIKVVTDSDDLVMLDLTDADPDYVSEPGAFSKDFVAKKTLDFSPIHHWFFSQQIDLKSDRPVDAIRTFDLENGELVAKFYPLSQAPSVSHTELADYVAEQNSKPARAPATAKKKPKPKRGKAVAE